MRKASEDLIKLAIDLSKNSEAQTIIEEIEKKRAFYWNQNQETPLIQQTLLKQKQYQHT